MFGVGTGTTGTAHTLLRFIVAVTLERQTIVFKMIRWRHVFVCDGQSISTFVLWLVVHESENWWLCWWWCQGSYSTYSIAITFHNNADGEFQMAQTKCRFEPIEEMQPLRWLRKGNWWNWCHCRGFAPSSAGNSEMWYNWIGQFWKRSKPMQPNRLAWDGTVLSTWSYTRPLEW